MPRETTNLSPWTVVAHGSYFDSSEIEHLVKSLVDSLKQDKLEFYKESDDIPDLATYIPCGGERVRYGINRMLVSLRNPTAQQSRSQLKKPSLPQQDLTEGVAGDSPLISTFGKPQPLKSTRATRVLCIYTPRNLGL
jgi:hypothetical protein